MAGAAKVDRGDGSGSRLMQSIAAPYELLGRDIVIGTSIGIALSEPGLPVSNC